MYLNNFQSYIFGGILIFMVCLVACEKNENEVQNFELNQNFKLKKNSLSSIGYNQELNLFLEEITDSRCPVNANCISAGNASVALKITDNKNGFVKLKLNYGQESNFKPDTAYFILNSKSYLIILNDVNPYPQTDKRNVEKEATLMVKLKISK